MRTITVPLTLINLEDNSFHILVEIVVFGVKRIAVVDTGASRTVFDYNLLKENIGDLSITDDIQASTLFSNTNTSTAIIPKFSIGALTIKTYETVGIDLSSVSETYKEKGFPTLSAIIGGDILVKYNCKIDYKSLSIKFYK